MHNEYLETYFNQYMDLSDNKKGKLGNKCDPVNLFLVDVYNYDDWLRDEESADTIRKNDKKESVDLSDMSPLEGDKEEVKEEKGLKILTPNKLLISLSILLAQIKAGNNLYKLKNEIKQILCLFYEHNKINKRIYNNLIKSL